MKNDDMRILRSNLTFGCYVGLLSIFITIKTILNEIWELSYIICILSLS